VRSLAAAVLLAITLTACAVDDEVPAAAPGPATTAAPEPPTSAPRPHPGPTTTSTSTTAPPPRVVFLTEGSTGGGVWELEARLAELGYWPGTVDAAFDANTRHAVTALQKVAGVERTGRVDLATEWALRGALLPAVRNPVGHVIEVDLATQVLTIATDGRIDAVFDSSTGKRSTRTPPGTFTLTRQIDALRRSHLGLLYRPKYFNRGIAVHGATSVPTYAASHGCVRVTYPAMDHIWAADLAPIGTEVTVA